MARRPQSSLSSGDASRVQEHGMLTAHDIATPASWMTTRSRLRTAGDYHAAVSATPPPSASRGAHPRPQSQPLHEMTPGALGGPTEGTRSAAAAAAAAAAPPIKVKKKRIRIKTERRREQCRRNQERYRNKQRHFAIELESKVEELRNEVRQLEEQRARLYYGVNLRESAVKTVMEYFRLFRHGLNVREDNFRAGVGRRYSSHSQLRHRLPRVDQQLEFLSFAFDRNVRMDDLFGRDNFIEQTRRFSTFYDGLLIELVQFESVTTHDLCTSVAATIRMEVTVSHATIQHVFPHLQHPQHELIKWKLIGQRLVCPASAVYVFDKDGLIMQVDWTIDFVAALYHVLTIDEIAIVLQQAHIVRDAYLVGNNKSDQEEKVERHDPNGRFVELSTEPVGWNGSQRSSHRKATDWEVWLHDESSQMEARPQVLLSDTGDDEGVLLHDGKGDDFVMV